MESDHDLLRRYEPILRFTEGERFFPMDTEPYVAASSLWAIRRNGETVCVTPAGALRREQLGDQPIPNDSAMVYLNLTDTLRTDDQVGKHVTPPVFRPGRGRLSRVGYSSRIVDALFTLALLARGRLPGATAASAFRFYRRVLEQTPQYVYHGRVVRQGPWTILQYWLFYAFNDWRTSYNGANDHEADWEMVAVFLAPDQTGALAPEWVVASEHYETGPDQRRRWDDPDIEIIDNHPVIYVGVGSHANFMRRGEYLTEVNLRVPQPISRFGTSLRASFRRIIRQYTGTDPEAAVSVPFVDYARGDGFSLGPGQQQAWNEPIVIDHTLEWISRYRGLWGIYARDPFPGENAPRGPMYDPEGNPRQAWFDPISWAALNDTLPRPLLLPALQAELANQTQQIEQLTALVDQQRETLVAAGLSFQATRSDPTLRRVSDQQRLQLDQLNTQHQNTQRLLAESTLVHQALQRRIKALEAGDYGAPQAHLQRPAEPALPSESQAGRLVELWSAMSVGLLLICFAGLVLGNRAELWDGIVALVLFFAILEASFRGWLRSLVTVISLVLAIMCIGILLSQFGWWIVSATFAAAALYILAGNLRDFTR